MLAKKKIFESLHNNSISIRSNKTNKFKGLMTSPSKCRSSIVSTVNNLQLLVSDPVFCSYEVYFHFNCYANNQNNKCIEV